MTLVSKLKETFAIESLGRSKNLAGTTGGPGETPGVIVPAVVRSLLKPYQPYFRPATRSIASLSALRLLFWGSMYSALAPAVSTTREVWTKAICGESTTVGSGVKTMRNSKE